MKIGLVQSVEASDNYGLDPASGVGDIHVVEHVPTRAIHNISVRQMVLMKTNMRKAGISLENGTAVLQGIVFNLVYYSLDSGAVLRQYLSCSYDSGSVSVEAHRITMASGQFKALDVQGLGF